MMDTVTITIVFFCAFISMSVLFWLQTKETRKAQKLTDELMKIYEETVDKYVNLSHDYSDLSQKYQKLLVRDVTDSH